MLLSSANEKTRTAQSMLYSFLLNAVFHNNRLPVGFEVCVGHLTRLKLQNTGNW